jgi:hypothetical protein
MSWVSSPLFLDVLIAHQSPFLYISFRFLMKFFDKSVSAYRSEDVSQQAGYRCAGRIAVEQNIYAMTLSADAQLVAFGGKI